MNILNDKTELNYVSNVETEQVQQEQTEYCLLGTFLRTKGLSLFFYDPKDGKVTEATIRYSDTLHLYLLPDNKFITIDWEAQKCTVEGKYVYFEALNLRTAQHRVKRYKAGNIKELANLVKPNPEGIKFF